MPLDNNAMVDWEEQHKELLTEAARPLTSPEVYAQSIGHSDFQIEEFIVNNYDFPTDDLKHKQAVLELWARYNAYNSAKYNADILVCDIEQLRAELADDKTWMESVARKRKKIEIEYKEGQLAIARLDMEYRTLREARKFMEIARKYQPSQKPRNEAERENWTAKAANDKKVAELMNRISGSKMLSHKEN